ncbi:MAG: nucleoside deaminase [Anaerolineaceae bacterium]|nr:nucleoside deaminase [Anaerolineaceae bacterium]
MPHIFSNTNLQIRLELPDWAIAELNQLPTHLPTYEEQMAAVIKFSRLNIQHQTGGPFAAGVFERDTGRLVVIGVNRVVPHSCSSAHAEVLALSLAQHRLGTFDLGGPGLPAHQLVVNWRPCAMCYGATIWSGVQRVVIAGGGPELEDITGFDEGPIHPNWRHELQIRGIDLVEDVMKVEAIQVFHEFAASNQLVYNGRLGSAGA